VSGISTKDHRRICFELDVITFPHHGVLPLEYLQAKMAPPVD